MKKYLSVVGLSIFLAGCTGNNSKKGTNQVESREILRECISPAVFECPGSKMEYVLDTLQGNPQFSVVAVDYERNRFPDWDRFVSVYVAPSSGRYTFDQLEQVAYGLLPVVTPDAKDWGVGYRGPQLYFDEPIGLETTTREIYDSQDFRCHSGERTISLMKRRTLVTLFASIPDALSYRRDMRNIIDGVGYF